MALLTRWYRLWLLGFALNVPTAAFGVTLVVLVFVFHHGPFGRLVSDLFMLMALAAVVVTMEQLTLYKRLRRKGVL